MELTLECQKRTPGSKPKALRREGLIPASLYGHNGTESIALMVDERRASALLRSAKSAKGERTKIQLNVPDLSWSGPVVIQEVQTHPWKGFVYHLSFYAGSKA